ncbi:MAG: hypothetical protein JSR80_00485 [Verrucomicrobia bacterium]|nr:hypothetical protein [Verrucomicrobiota bacterium]
MLGREEGVVLGVEKEKKTIALEMFKQGCDLTLVHNVTKISFDDLKLLLQQDLSLRR